MTKPFTSIEDQVTLLEKRGVSTDENTPGILLREGYYSVVNGYKDPFIDKEASAAAGDDRYSEGTTFNDIYSLFQFDRDLRESTFHYLIRAEAMLKTIVSYTFAESHSGNQDYLDQSSFATEDEYATFGLKDYRDNMHRLHTKLYEAANNRGNQAVVHYLDAHGYVPVWVVFNGLTFGSVEHFFNLMKPTEQRAVCKRIAEATGGRDTYLDPKQARISMDTAVRARNICAHDDRLYCARIGSKRNFVNYAGMTSRLRDFQTIEAQDGLIEDMVNLATHYSLGSAKVEEILSTMGFRIVEQTAEDEGGAQGDKEE